MKFYLIKKVLRNLKIRLKKEIQAEFNNKGFSLISTLVASVIGLIVIFGLNKSLVHLNTQSMQLHSQIKQQNLYKRVGEFFGNKLRCTKHFSINFPTQVTTTTSFGFQALRGSNIDLSNSNFLKSHGLKSGSTAFNYFDTICSGSFPKTCTIKMYIQDDNEVKVQFITVQISDNGTSKSTFIDTYTNPGDYRYECT